MVSSPVDVTALEVDKVSSSSSPDVAPSAVSAKTLEVVVEIDTELLLLGLFALSAEGGEEDPWPGDKASAGGLPPSFCCRYSSTSEKRIEISISYFYFYFTKNMFSYNRK